MNRALIFGIALFFAVLGLSLTGGDASKAVAGHGCHGCHGCDGGCDGGCHADKCNGCNGDCHADKCNGCRGCRGGLLKKLFSRRCHGRRCHGCNGGNGCNGGHGCHGGDAKAAEGDAPAAAPAADAAK